MTSLRNFHYVQIRVMVGRADIPWVPTAPNFADGNTVAKALLTSFGTSVVIDACLP